MRREIMAGALAGAAGTALLNVAGYLDMAIRGRPASDLPGRLVTEIAKRAGVDRAAEAADDAGDGESTEGTEGDEAWQTRADAIGGLLGHAIGIGIGAGYGLLRARCRRLPRPIAAAGLGAAAMAASDVPLVALRLTDPRTWGPSGWVSDAVPHLCYGAVTAATFDLLYGPSRARSRCGPSTFTSRR